ncbi:MAG: isoprenylcysteine carboxylmethyltransferase family protein [Actinobacteria bacterium]|nr:isoprenylcysteine carboxylmethyltransferase family protein [Actinomycetota bacterium]
MRAFIFKTRGLYLIVSLVLILILKHAYSSRVSAPVYLASLLLSVLVLALRMWAAGFVGSTARSGETHADVLLTNGPYAYVRNPMYLTALLLGLLFGVMSGFWYSLLIWLVAYAFVYGQVIPYEEAFLKRKFGREYEEYCRRVPRLIPTLKGYASGREGVFSIRESLLNEVAPLIVLPALWLAYWRL